MWVNGEDIAKMAAVVEMSVEDFEAEYVRRVGVRKSLIEYDNGDCVFFDNKSRKCGVYAARPRQCRTWPFWDSNIRTPEAWAEPARPAQAAAREGSTSSRQIQRAGGRDPDLIDWRFRQSGILLSCFLRQLFTAGMSRQCLSRAGSDGIALSRCAIMVYCDCGDVRDSAAARIARLPRQMGAIAMPVSRGQILTLMLTTIRLGALAGHSPGRSPIGTNPPFS